MVEVESDIHSDDVFSLKTLTQLYLQFQTFKLFNYFVPRQHIFVRTSFAENVSLVTLNVSFRL